MLVTLYCILALYKNKDVGEYVFKAIKNKRYENFKIS